MLTRLPSYVIHIKFNSLPAFLGGMCSTLYPRKHQGGKVLVRSLNILSPAFVAAFSESAFAALYSADFVSSNSVL